MTGKTYCTICREPIPESRGHLAVTCSSYCAGRLKTERSHRWLGRRTAKRAVTRKPTAYMLASPEQWAALMADWAYRCAYCTRHLSPRNMTADHIIPKMRGGTDFVENLVPCCRSCNSSKGNKTADEFGIYLLAKGGLSPNLDRRRLDLLGIAAASTTAEDDLEQIQLQNQKQNTQVPFVDFAVETPANHGLGLPHGQCISGASAVDDCGKSASENHPSTGFNTVSTGITQGGNQ